MSVNKWQNKMITKIKNILPAKATLESFRLLKEPVWIHGTKFQLLEFVYRIDEEVFRSKIKYRVLSQKGKLY